MTALARTAYSLELQQAFADASGDYNPLHLDAVQARRSGSGQIVVHGVHVFIWALEQLCGNGFLTQDALSDLQIICKFKKPVFIGENLELFHRKRLRNAVEVFTVEKEGTSLVSIQLRREAAKEACESADVLDSYQLGKLKNPLQLDLVALERQNLRLEFGSLDTVYLERTFPLLLECLSYERLNAIAVLSSAVGMIAPGKYSLFTGFVLGFTPLVADQNVGFLHIDNFNSRHSLMNMSFFGCAIYAKIEALARPEPVLPPTGEYVRKQVGERNYDTGTVLIIGGSRGIGAIAARILSAGGAKVIVTYRSGREDAQELALDPNIECSHFDAFKSDIVAFVEQLPTDVSALLYFATPKIFFRRTLDFHQEKLESFRYCYIDIFQELFMQLRAHSPVFKRVLYPSTIEVENSETSSFEYRQAKQEAEELCLRMAVEFNTIMFLVPRLPKISTDQTAWFSQESVGDRDLNYIISLIDQLYS